MPPDGIGMWDINMPHGCFKEQIVYTWCLGAVLVWYSCLLKYIFLISSKLQIQPAFIYCFFFYLLCFSLANITLCFQIQRWSLSFGSQKVAKVQLALYSITLLKTMLPLLFFLTMLLLKVCFLYSQAHYLCSCLKPAKRN